MQITSVKLGGLRVKPSALGWLFFVMILLGWVMSVNYNNNLLYMVVFIMLSLMLVSLIIGFFNIRQVQVVGIKTIACFAQEKLKIEFNAVNDGFTSCESVFINQPMSRGVNSRTSGKRFNIRSNSIEVVDLDIDATKRGLVSLIPLNLASVYPIGLFIFYRPILNEVSEWVYPEPVGNYRLEDYLDKHSNQSGIEADEMQTLRPYQPSDSPSHINWKAYARSDELMTTDYDGGMSIPSVILDAQMISDLEVEARLSQLSKWIIEIDNLGGEYGLKLGSKVIPASKGGEHRQNCLIALAQFDASYQADSTHQVKTASNSLIDRIKTSLSTPIGKQS